MKKLTCVALCFIGFLSTAHAQKYQCGPDVLDIEDDKVTYAGYVYPNQFDNALKSERGGILTMSYNNRKGEKIWLIDGFSAAGKAVITSQIFDDLTITMYAANVEDMIPKRIPGVVTCSEIS